MASSVQLTIGDFRQELANKVDGQPGVPTNNGHLSTYVGTVFWMRENRQRAPTWTGHDVSEDDKGVLLDVFWDLFRQGLISIEMPTGGMGLHFRLSAYGQQVLRDPRLYFYHDASSYEAVLRNRIQDIDNVTLMYVREAILAFASNCYLAAAVMAGVASEHEFDMLLEAIETSPKYAATFASVSKERSILRRIEKFREKIEGLLGAIPQETKEGLDTQLLGIQELIRTYRNSSGHPTGRVVTREESNILLNLFIPYCAKLHELRAFFTAP